MIRYLKGNLFDSNAQTLVNTVNCVGVMGKGVALLFKKRFPEMYEDYHQQCKLGNIRPGVLTIYKASLPWVLNFPTKRHWKSPSHIEDIDLGLREFVRQYKEWGITSIAFPALGCGQGGLDWALVKPLIEKHLGCLDITIEVYEPGSEIIPAEYPQSEEENDKELVKDLFGDLVEPPKAKSTSKKRKKQ